MKSHVSRWPGQSVIQSEGFRMTKTDRGKMVIFIQHDRIVCQGKMNFIWRHLDFSLGRSFFIQHTSTRQKSLTDEKLLLEHLIELKEIDSSSFTEFDTTNSQVFKTEKRLKSIKDEPSYSVVRNHTCSNFMGGSALTLDEKSKPRQGFHFELSIENGVPRWFNHSFTRTIN